MCVLQQDDECGYNVTEVLHISAEGTEFLCENYEVRWAGWKLTARWPTRKTPVTKGHERHLIWEQLWQQAAARRLAARKQCDGGCLEHVLE